MNSKLGGWDLIVEKARIQCCNNTPTDEEIALIWADGKILELEEESERLAKVAYDLCQIIEKAIGSTSHEIN